MLSSEAIRFAGLNGARCFDFLRGNEPYKYRFGAVDRIDETWLLPRGLGGWILGRKHQLIRAQRRRAGGTQRQDEG
jgi:CelD/BcsL family acetyltransferase involved in cellulose biosynthesis